MKQILKKTHNTINVLFLGIIVSIITIASAFLFGACTNSLNHKGVRVIMKWLIISPSFISKNT